MIKVFNKTTGEFIGRISDEELKFLADQLEEESIHDTDYYIRLDSLQQFAGLGASPRLLELLKGGLRSENAIEIRWERDNYPAK
jgi:hypothetical protein